MTKITIPDLGESITEAIVAKIFKPSGSTVKVDEPLLELETDKVTVELPAPGSGVIAKLGVNEGDTVNVGDVIGEVATDKQAASTSKSGKKNSQPEAAAPAPVAADATEATNDSQSVTSAAVTSATIKAGPAARQAMQDLKVDPQQVTASGPHGTITPQDVTAARPTTNHTANQQSAPLPERKPDPRGEEIVSMSRLRQRIAERLKSAQNTAALLTTFNEINMSSIVNLRSSHRENFQNRHGVRLGFMSFFVTAAVIALRDYPAINAEIYGKQIIYKKYYDIGIAVGTPQGLVVPVLKDANLLNFAQIEQGIIDFGKRAREGKLTIAEISGGTFSITNGGIYGSLLSTPILNPPQSAILGLHKIMSRPVVDDNDKIVAAPMMNVALTYDHRIVDGKEAVSFLVRIKDLIEDPALLMFD